MSAEVIAAGAVGAGTAGLVMAYDQNLAMAVLGGSFFYMAVSAKIPLQTRLFYSFGSLIIGYFVGIFFMSSGPWALYAAIAAFLTSALGSSIFGSLYAWFDGGVTPWWIKFIAKMVPFSWKKGDPNE